MPRQDWVLWVSHREIGLGIRVPVHRVKRLDDGLLDELVFGVGVLVHNVAELNIYP